MSQPLTERQRELARRECAVLWIAWAATLVCFFIPHWISAWAVLLCAVVSALEARANAFLRRCAEDELAVRMAREKLVEAQREMIRVRLSSPKVCPPEEP